MGSAVSSSLFDVFDVVWNKRCVNCINRNLCVIMILGLSEYKATKMGKGEEIVEIIERTLLMERIEEFMTKHKI